MSATSEIEIELGYEDWGPSNGRTVVFLPGGMHSRRFRHPDPVDGVRLITVDRPGYGLTPPMPLTRWSALLSGLFDRLDVDRAGLVGWSAGSRHALACAAADPERFLRVALAAPEPELVDIDRHPMAHLYRLALDDVERARPLAEALVAAGLADLDATVERLVIDYRMTAIAADPRLRTMYAASLREAARQGATGMLADAASSSDRWPFDLASVRALVRIYAGRDDPLFPDSVLERLARSLDAELVVVDAGHDVPLAAWPDMLRWAAAS